MSVNAVFLLLFNVLLGLRGTWAAAPGAPCLLAAVGDLPIRLPLLVLCLGALLEHRCPLSGGRTLLHLHTSQRIGGRAHVLDRLPGLGGCGLPAACCHSSLAAKTTTARVPKIV